MRRSDRQILRAPGEVGIRRSASVCLSRLAEDGLLVRDSVTSGLVWEDWLYEKVRSIELKYSDRWGGQGDVARG